jgi:hypothetical protein
MSRDEKVQLLK